MSNFALQVKRFGLAKESVRGTAESAPTSWFTADPSSEMDYKLKLLDDKGLRGVMAEYPGIAGNKDGEGTLAFPLRASDIGEFIHMHTGNPVSAEEATVTITLNTNDYIDFIEDGGSEVSAQLTAGTYAYGTTSATAGTLCALIKSRMEAVNGSDTYTVTYSYATKKFTITKSAGVFVINWLTGTNNAKGAHTVLGFTKANTSSAIAQTSDSTTAQWAFLHTFTQGSTLSPQAYTIFVDRSVSVMKYNLCNVSEFKIASAPDNLVEVGCKVFFKSEASGSIGSPTYVESGALSFQHDSIKIATVANTEVKQFEITLTNGLLKKRVLATSADINDLVSTKFEAKGSLTIYIADEVERAKFLAGTSTSLEFIIAGATIAGSTKYQFEVLLDDVQYTAFPYQDEDGLIASKVTFKANYSVTNSRLYRIRLYNIASSY